MLKYSAASPLSCFSFAYFKSCVVAVVELVATEPALYIVFSLFLPFSTPNSVFVYI